MRRAPPIVPGTPTRPSMPPRSCLAQKVTVRPRSAAASTRASFPSKQTSGLGLASCSTTQGSSPSPTSRLEPPPRNLCGILWRSRRSRTAGRESCLEMRSRSVVPPMPRDVRLDKAIPGCNSTWSFASSARIVEWSIRMGIGCKMRRVFRAEQEHEFVAGTGDTTSTNREDGVTGPGVFEEETDAVLHGADIVDIFVTGFADGGGQGFAGDAGDGWLAGGVDVGKDQQVGLIKSTGEFFPEMLRPGVAVRLEKDQQPVEFATAGGFESGFDFGGMVAVIVYDRDVVDGAFDVEAAADSAEICQAQANKLRGDIEIESDSRGGGCIADVVDAGRMRKHKQAEVFAFIGEAEFTGQASQFDVADEQVRLAGSTVRENGALDVGNDGLNVRFVEAQDGGAVKRDTVDELGEGVLDIGKRRVLIEVFAVDGGDHSDDRSKEQEAAVAFIGFDDKIFAAGGAGGGSGLIDFAADHKSGVKMCGGEDGCDKRSGGGFAVRAAHGDAVLETHEFGEHLGSGNYGNFPLVGFHHFGVVGFNGRRGDDDVRAFHVGGLVPFIDGGAEILQPFGNRGELAVGAGNGVAEGEEHFSYAAHADAADTDEVDALEVAEGNHHSEFFPRLCPAEVLACTPATSSIRLTMSRAAFGRPSDRALAASCWIWSGPSRNVKISAVRRAAVSSFSTMTLPAPALAIS